MDNIVLVDGHVIEFLPTVVFRRASSCTTGNARQVAKLARVIEEGP